jgi:hypothetical protein
MKSKNQKCYLGSMPDNWLTLQPIRRLTNVLFPAFGEPIMATLSSSESAGMSGESSEIAVCSAKKGKDSIAV